MLQPIVWRYAFLVRYSMILVALATVATVARAEQSSSVAGTADQALLDAREARMKWWREARFGMFVHWGLYSIPAGQWDDRKWTRGGVEWIQLKAGVSADEYAQRLVPQFKPSPDFARQWAEVAKAAGCKYVVFTNKHHDGFALHDSDTTTFDAKDVTGRDLHQEIVQAIRQAGLKVGVYHSLWDWHHPDAYAGSGAVNVRGTSMKGREPKRYVAYLHRQVEELVSNYGPFDVLWFDYSSRTYQGKSWQADELLRMIRKHQPQVIVNNRLYRSAEAGWGDDWAKKRQTLDPRYGDFTTPEQHIPEGASPDVDWETCMTMNTTWGYSQHDHAWKSTSTLIRNLIDIASKGGNYLLNIGPKADGSVPEESIVRMREIGQWMDWHGESIYGTKASPFAQTPWGRCTQKQLADNTTRIYLHLFDWPQAQKLSVPLGNQVTACRLLGETPRQLDTERDQHGIQIQLSGKAPDTIASVIALDIQGLPETLPADSKP